VFSDPLISFLKKFFPLSEFKVEASKLYPKFTGNCFQLRAQRLPTKGQYLLQKVPQISEVALSLGELMEVEGGCGYLCSGE
jgi:hypothetical protein